MSFPSGGARDERGDNSRCSDEKTPRPLVLFPAQISGLGNVLLGPGGLGKPVQNQLATPPWYEQVPRRCSLKLYEPSRQRAVAPSGADGLNIGLCT
jgi:hypothetical protein